MSEERKDWEVSCWSCKLKLICRIYPMAAPLVEELCKKELYNALFYNHMAELCDSYDPQDYMEPNPFGKCIGTLRYNTAKYRPDPNIDIEENFEAILENERKVREEGS